MASEGGGDEWDKEDKTDGIDADNDLKEHMVSILFSRNKLSHLQKQVTKEQSFIHILLQTFSPPTLCTTRYALSFHFTQNIM